MEKNIHELLKINNPDLPFVFHMNVVRKISVHTHWHESTEFLCCFEGSGTVISDSREIKMSVGDTVIINSKRIHSIMSDSFVKYYCLIIDNSFFKENCIDINSLNFTEKICDIKINELIVKLCNVYIDINSEFYVAENRTALSDFMTYVTKNYSYKTNSSNHKTKSHNAILSAIDYINEHYNERISIDEISNNAGYSKYHFARIFKEVMGYTIVDHLNATRCEKAKHMLLETTKPISQICFDCGFEYSSYFSKIFKQHYNCIPSDFRKKYSKLI